MAPFRLKKKNDIAGFALQRMKMIHQLLGLSHAIVEEPQSGYVGK
jgi:hypothetical protein